MNGIRIDSITNTYSLTDPNAEVKKFWDNNEGRLMYITIANKSTNAGYLRIFINGIELYRPITPGNIFTTTDRVIPYGVVDVNVYSYEWVLTGDSAVVAGNQVMIYLHRYTIPIKEFCPPKIKL